MSVQRALAWLPAAVGALLLVSACPGTERSEQAAPRGTSTTTNPVASAELVFNAGVLSLESPGGSRQTLSANAPLPYQIIRTAKPALVTTLSAELVPSTYAIADQIHAYGDTLPVFALGQTAALASASISDTALGNLILLNPQGAAGWQADAAELVIPGAGASPNALFIAICGKDADSIYQFGTAPQLVCLDAKSLKERWRENLPAKSKVAGVDFYALNQSAGLISLQYDYTVYEFLLFSLDSGKLLSRNMLNGQPAVRAVWPGPDYEPAELQATPEQLSVAVYFNEQQPQRWSFATDGGALTTASIELPRTLRAEENPQPQGNLAGKRAHFLQSTLPVASGKQWRIPAYLNAEGQVLIVDAAGARFVAGAK